MGAESESRGTSEEAPAITQVALAKPFMVEGMRSGQIPEIL